MKRIGLFFVVFAILLSFNCAHAEMQPIPTTSFNTINHVTTPNERQLQRKYAMTTPRRWRDYLKNLHSNLKKLIIGDVGEFKKESDDLDLTRFKHGEVYFGCLNVKIPKKVKFIVGSYATWIKVKDVPKRGLITQLKEDGYLWIVKHWNETKHRNYR